MEHKDVRQPHTSRPMDPPTPILTAFRSGSRVCNLATTTMFAVLAGTLLFGAHPDVIRRKRKGRAGPGTFVQGSSLFAYQGPLIGDSPHARRTWGLGPLSRTARDATGPMGIDGQQRPGATPGVFG